jgi:hypothetical protein
MQGWPGRIGLLIVVLLLIGGRRPGTGPSKGCGQGGGGCFSGGEFRRSRAVKFLPDHEDPARHTLHFYTDFTSSVSGRDIPPTVGQLGLGEPLAADMLLDSASELYLFVDASGPGGELRASSFFEPLRLLPWTKFLYTGPDEGPVQRAVVPIGVPLALWQVPMRPVRSARVYDHGACFADVSLTTLADRFVAAVRDRFDKCDSRYRLELDVAPWLRTPVDGGGQVPIKGNSPDDKLVWHLRVKGQMQFTSPGDYCLVNFPLALDDRMVHGFRVERAGMRGGQRVRVDSFALLDGAQIGRTPPGEWEKVINRCGNIGGLVSPGLNVSFDDCLARLVPRELEDGINNAMIIPMPRDLDFSKKKSSLDDFIRCVPGGTPACPGGGPEDGCWRPGQLGEKERFSFLIAEDSVTDEFKKQQQGYCVIRLQPKRINITPSGFQVVLAETMGDPHFSLLQPAKGAFVQCPEAAAMGGAPVVTQGLILAPKVTVDK